MKILKSARFCWQKTIRLKSAELIQVAWVSWNIFYRSGDVCQNDARWLNWVFVSWSILLECLSILDIHCCWMNDRVIWQFVYVRGLLHKHTGNSVYLFISKILIDLFTTNLITVITDIRHWNDYKHIDLTKWSVLFFKNVWRLVVGIMCILTRLCVGIALLVMCVF